MGKDIWVSWSKNRRTAFVIGVMVIVAAASIVGWWTMRTPYAVLFSNLRDVDAAEIATALDAAQTPHRYSDNGATLLVPEEAVYDTRMKLVSQGIPHGGSVGFEVFKDSDFGVTEFAQRVNYQRALQGELERTINTIPDVQSSRVHLTLRKAGMFDTGEAPSKGSVSLTLRTSAQLSRAQVAGIQRLVASAVDGLTPEAVAVIGEGGVALSAQVGGDNGEEQTRVEARLRQRVQDLLRDAMGIDAGSTVSVNAVLNYDRVRQVHERLVTQGKDGNGLLVRQRTANSHAALTGNEESARPQGSGESESEYAHGRDQEEVELAPGHIQRLTVGIVVPAGTTQAVVTALYDIIASAVGIDLARGDKLSIVALGDTRAVARKTAAAVVPAPANARLPVQTHAWWPTPPSWALVAVGTALGSLVAAGTWLGVVRRRRKPARLTHESREALLGEVREWLASSESVR